MQEKNSEDRIDDLISRIDEFMAEGGGRMKITGGDGDAKEYHCTACCGEDTDPVINTPVKID